METVFNVGDVVYDSVNYPNQKGKVIRIETFGTWRIIVMFDNETDEDRYFGDGSFWKNAIATLSFTPYELKGFSQVGPWTPEIFEWIAVRNSDTEYYRIVQFETMVGNYYRADLREYEFAKPLTDFINER